MSDIQVLKEKVRALKVLFVDDEYDVRKGTGMFLKKFFDDVVVCENGKKGLEEFLAAKDFDVVITDILMPIMDGVEMSKKMREIDDFFYDSIDINTLMRSVYLFKYIF